ncbi:hypothetical protein [Chryseoglobus sp. 28M-23]|uniref:hypothetical protein n=1 Tax=Chryseoglobus sp. 28M-23 TaxID=2772253 RepID=UPI001745CAE3|nr:hypothetical protein [Chryseoglobus sp. 28M-23]MBU1251512.1 hypothetical protein [Actinomycetota bacterium]MBU1608393.1 hypothetical protein [Actinomycetota bacterium]MBU2316485.1 hypothetical protein [Actinomycetota bacterium]MBU2386195.1 hypothetical protein [Actinomycetota bacterium]QOD92929.1 hypothetical protein IE160_08180 [Chryseoglobus sp. 28M-23]
MSSHHEQPMSRREAREAAERAERAARESAEREAAGRERVSSAVPTPTPASPGFVSSAPVAPPAEPAQRMRRRDFRPPSEQEAPRASFAPAVDEDAPLEYRTERPVDAPSSHHVAEPRPGARQPSAPHVISEHTLSRRQLRSLRDVSDPVVPPVVEAPAPSPHETTAPPTHHTAPPSHTAPPVDSAPPPSHTLPSPAPLPPSAPVPPPLIEPEATPDELVEPSSSSAPTTGSHWSVGVHDDEDPFTNTFSREVGSASHSTNALVLPQMPVSNLSGPVTGTGEIIVTGMIEVPRIVTSTGTVPSVHDSADVDDYVEPGDVELTSTGAAPVSALRAVSGHTGTGNIVHGKPQRNGNTLTTVLVAATVVMAVVAIGLFVLAAVNGLF